MTSVLRLIAASGFLMGLSRPGAWMRPARRAVEMAQFDAVSVFGEDALLGPLALQLLCGKDAVGFREDGASGEVG